MMCIGVSLLLVMVSVSLSAPSPIYEDLSIPVPQKKAALVLDRLLIALQKALHDSPPSYRLDPEGPRVAPLRIGMDDMRDGDDLWLGPDDLSVAPLRPRIDDMTGLQRRGQASAQGVRGRVLRCYFNAITCF